MGELAVILVVALLVLGPKMLPEIATGLGKVIREIRKATADISKDFELDEMIRNPLQELRDAATLPPEELKRRDEARAAQRKAAEEEASRKQREAKETEEARLKQQAKEAADKAAADKAIADKVAADKAVADKAVADKAAANKAVAIKAVAIKAAANKAVAIKAAAALPKPSSPSDVVSAGGTMVANPPPADELQTLTPMPDVHTPAPAALAQPPRLPPPPLPPSLQKPRPTEPAANPAAVSDRTVVDLQAQLNAAASAKTMLAMKSPATPQRAQPLQKTVPGSKKD